MDTKYILLLVAGSLAGLTVVIKNFFGTRQTKQTIKKLSKELTDAAKERQRLQDDLALRRALGALEQARTEAEAMTNKEIEGNDLASYVNRRTGHKPN